MKITLTDNWLEYEYNNVPVGIAEVIARLLSNLAKSLDIVEEIRDLRKEEMKDV